MVNFVEMRTFLLFAISFSLTPGCFSQTRKRNDYQWDKYVQPLMDSVQKACSSKIYYRSYCTILKKNFLKIDSVTSANYGISGSDLSCIYDSWSMNLLPVPEVWKQETFPGSMSDAMQEANARIYSVSLPIFICPNVYMIETYMMRRCNSALSTTYIIEYNEQAKKIKVRYSIKRE